MTLKFCTNQNTAPQVLLCQDNFCMRSTMLRQASQWTCMCIGEVCLRTLTFCNLSAVLITTFLIINSMERPMDRVASSAASIAMQTLTREIDWSITKDLVCQCMIASRLKSRFSHTKLDPTKHKQLQITNTRKTPVFMIQWKITLNERKLRLEISNFLLNHDYGRKGSDANPTNSVQHP